MNNMMILITLMIIVILYCRRTEQMRRRHEGGGRTGVGPGGREKTGWMVTATVSFIMEVRLVNEIIWQ